MAEKTFFTLGSGSRVLGPTYDEISLSLVHDLTKTVKSSGGDATTIEAGIDIFNDSYLGDNCKLSVDEGLSITSPDNADSVYGVLVIEGDTRELAGQCYFHNRAIVTASSNGGAGTCTLSRPMTDQIKIEGSTTDPDLDADGWGAGDVLQIGRFDTGGTNTEIIESISGNTITLETTTSDPGGNGGYVVIRPNRVETFEELIVNNPFLIVKIKGFSIRDSATTALVRASNGGNYILENCFLSHTSSQPTILCDNARVFLVPKTVSIHDGTYNIHSTNGGIVQAQEAHFIHPETSCVFSENGGRIDCQNSLFMNVGARDCFKADHGGFIYANGSSTYCISNTGRCATIDNGSFLDISDGDVDSVSAGTADGITIQNGSKCNADNTIIDKFDIGLFVERGSSASIVSGGVTNSTTGIKVDRNSYVDATSTSSNMSGNTTDYSPSSSDSVGNVDSVITHS